MKLFIGNLSFQSSEASILELFESFGEVDSCNLITDRDTGRSRGFAFVEMSDPDAAQKAISELDGSEIEGRNIKVNEAQDRPRRDSRDGGGGRGGGGGGGGRGYSR